MSCAGEWCANAVCVVRVAGVAGIACVVCVVCVCMRLFEHCLYIKIIHIQDHNTSAEVPMESHTESHRMHKLR